MVHVLVVLVHQQTCRCYCFVPSYKQYNDHTTSTEYNRDIRPQTNNIDWLKARIQNNIKEKRTTEHLKEGSIFLANGIDQYDQTGRGCGVLRRKCKHSKRENSGQPARFNVLWLKCACRLRLLSSTTPSSPANGIVLSNKPLLPFPYTTFHLPRECLQPLQSSIAFTLSANLTTHLCYDIVCSSGTCVLRNPFYSIIT